MAYQIPGSYSPPTEYRASVGLRGTLGATASGYVWNDLNNDGVWDAGEPPLQNAYVRAVKVDPDQWGVSFDQKYTYTDANGYWEVETTPGVWSISSSPPSGSSLNQTSAPDLPIPSSGWGNSMVIGTDDVENLNFGYTAPAPISGRVWQDVNKDGIQDAGEDGIESAYVRVEGLDSNGNPITNWGTYTDANGDWSINWTFPGNYRVTVDEYYLEHYATPQGFDNPTWDVDGVATPFTATVTVPEGGLTGVDFGLSAVARVGNNVFLDFSHDGLFDDQTEYPTLWGLTVQLRNAADDSIVDTVKFDMMTGDYEYKFKVLNDGTYYIYIPYEGDNIPLLDMVELTTGSNPDPTDGVDNDNNGVQDGNAIRTGNFTVSYDAGVPPPNYTVDIGLYMSDEDRIGNSTIEKFTQTLSAPDAPGVPVKVGDPVKWTYKITNNGIFPLQFADFWDDMVGPLSDPITGDMNYAIEDQSAFDDGMWSQGESVTLSAIGIAVEGPYQNTATAWVGTILAMTMDDFAYITDTSHYTGVTQGVEIVTELNGYDADPALGLLVPDNATLNWTFTVTNTGNFEDEFTVTNDQLDADDIVCDSSGSNVVTIGAGDSEVCRATTTSGIGAYTMNATASSDGITTYDVNGDPVAGTDYSAEDDGGYIGLESTISLVKKINGLIAPTAPGVDVAAGSTMNVSFEVTNTGNTALGNITIVDDTIASEDVNCPTTTLAPGASVTCTATLAAPPSGGTHVNNAEVQSTPIYDDSIPLIDIAPGNSPVVSDTATAHAAAVDLDIEVTKFIDGIHAPTAPGVLVGKPAMDLTFRVTNHSANTMTDVTLLDDDIPTLLISCPKSTLTAGESMDCASLTTLPAPTPGNPYSGDVTVTANTTLASGTVSVSDVDTAHAHAAEPAIGIQKFINGVSAPTTPGVQVPSMSTMNITYEVTNSGNTWLTGIAPVDDGGAAITCPSTLLAPSATMTCTASQPSPLATIVYSGQVTVEGTPSHSASLPIAGMDRVSSSDRGFAWSEAEAKVGVDTKINGKGGKVQVTPGSTMTVTHLVTNNGNSILTDVVLTNNGKPVKCPLTELKPGESMTCSEQVPAPPAGTAYVANAVVIGSPTAPNGTPIAGLGQVQDTSTAQASGISATNETTNRKPKDDRPNRLPNTGGPMIALLWLGAGLTLTGGVVLTGATRRRKKSV